jgi:hypothetical protein
MSLLLTKLAETLFIDMVNGNPGHSMNDVEEMAISSFQYASMFYSKASVAPEISDDPAPVKLKGCRACYGSGGKITKPCRQCGGSGKQPV